MSLHFRDWNSLREHGIDLLTGEACAYSMRGLCDLNEDGKHIMENFLGVQIESRPWNSSVNGKPSVASIMLTYDIFNALCIFIAFRAGYEYAVVGDHGIFAYTQEDLTHFGRTVDRVAELYGARVHRNYANPSCSVGGRNVHQMSGRAA